MSDKPRYYPWGAKRHLRAAPNSHRGLCGTGYDWPSTIALTEDPDEVTCGACVHEMNKAAGREGQGS